MSQMYKYVERVAKLSGLEEITPGQQLYIENLYAEGFSKNAAVRELLKFSKDAGSQPADVGTRRSGPTKNVENGCTSESEEC